MQQLPHAGIDHRVAGAALLPGLQLLAGAGIGHAGELGTQILPRGLRAVEQHVGVELPPGQFLTERGRAAGAQRVGVPVALGQIGEQTARMQLTELQRRGKI
jgi:hypothetical protein